MILQFDMQYWRVSAPLNQICVQHFRSLRCARISSYNVTSTSVCQQNGKRFSFMRVREKGKKNVRGPNLEAQTQLYLGYAAS